jgi:hypothetical protein
VGTERKRNNYTAVCREKHSPCCFIWLGRENQNQGYAVSDKQMSEHASRVHPEIGNFGFFNEAALP